VSTKAKASPISEKADHGVMLLIALEWTCHLLGGRMDQPRHENKPIVAMPVIV
jgi:hypothetical protein